MIGRGAIANPFLFEMIQENTTIFPDDHLEVFHEFLTLLLESHLSESSNQGNTLLKMKHYWEYFMLTFEDGQKYYRMVKKADSIEEYRQKIEQIIELERDI